MIAATLVMVLSGALPVIGNVLTHTSPAASSPASDAASVSTAASTAGVHPATSPTSPNPGELNVYEPYPGGATSEDPAVDYETVGAEPILNVFEQLVVFNGNNATGANVGQFSPLLATCVPGQVQCTNTYGGSGGLNPIPGFTGVFNAAGQVTTYAGTGANAPIYWTFIIDPNARFYDSGTWEPGGANYTGVSWPVYPTDVMFTYARQMAYSEAAGVGSTPGWLVAQALLQNGTGFDHGFHTPYNTTPGSILGSMLINSSAFCPGAAQNPALGNGCITFKADGGGAAWPSFLQLVGDDFYGITPASWYTETGGAGLPGWSVSSADHGDHGVGLPGGSGNSTAFNPGWTSYLHTLNTTEATTWDSYELKVAIDYPAPVPKIQWHAVGSGPYFLEATPKGSPGGYSLFQNPAYAQPLGCTQTVASLDYTGDCWPAADPTYTPPADPPCAPGGTPGYSTALCPYIPVVFTKYEPSDQAGISAYTAGTADLAGIYSTDAGTMLTLASEGKLNWYSAPSLSTFFLPINLNWSDTAYKADGFPGSPNVPNNFFSGSAVRGLLTHSFPYDTAEETANTVDGIQYAYMAGGPIAEGMVNYPSNVSYPYLQGNPNTNPSTVNGAAWWWAQGTDPTSPYYDSQLAACVTKTCVFPIVGENGAPNLDIMIGEYITEIESITDNHVKPFTFDLNFGGPGGIIPTQDVSPPGSGPLPYWNLGWAADNFEPWDYLAPLGYPNGTYTYSDAVEEQLLSNQYDNSAVCGHATKSLANLLYWAGQTELASDCQGVAYKLALEYFGPASHAGGALDAAYDYAIQAILANLNLYTYFGQTNEVYSVAPWINGSSINTNPTIGGGADNLWFQVSYVPPEQQVTFSQSGLTAGTWKITAGTLATSKSAAFSDSSLQFYEVTGTVPFSVAASDGKATSVTGATSFDAATGKGTVDVTGTTALTVNFAALPPSTNETLTFSESGLPAGTAWTVQIVQTGKGATGSGSNGTTAPGELNFTVPAKTTWKYTATATGLWKGNVKGVVKVASTGVTKTIAFVQEFEKVTFSESGLAKGTSWGVDIAGVPASSGGNAEGFLNTTSTTASVKVTLPYGLYYYVVTNETIPGTSTQYVVSPNSWSSPGALTIGSTKAQVFKIVYGSDKVIFSESGLKKGTSWTVSLQDEIAPGVWYNTSLSGTKATIDFQLPFGTVNYNATATGYSGSPGTGTFGITATHPAITVKTTFTATPIPPTGVPAATAARLSREA